MLICGEKGNLWALLHSVTGEFICVYGVLTALFCVALSPGTVGRYQKRGPDLRWPILSLVSTGCLGR